MFMGDFDCDTTARGDKHIRTHAHTRHPLLYQPPSPSSKTSPAQLTTSAQTASREGDVLTVNSRHLRGQRWPCWWTSRYGWRMPPRGLCLARCRYWDRCARSCRLGSGRGGGSCGWRQDEGGGKRVRWCGEQDVKRPTRERLQRGRGDRLRDTCHTLPCSLFLSSTTSNADSTSPMSMSMSPQPWKWRSSHPTFHLGLTKICALLPAGDPV